MDEAIAEGGDIGEDDAQGNDEVETYDMANIGIAQKAFEDAAKAGKVAFRHGTQSHAHSATRTHAHTHARGRVGRWQTMFEEAKKAGDDQHRFKLIMADPWYQEDKAPTDNDLVGTKRHRHTHI